jgi:hypothetical protein
MASGIGIIGMDVTDVTTTLDFALLARGAVDSQSGVKEYTYVSFPASTALAVGDVVLVSSLGAAAAATLTTTTPANAAGPRVGVVVTAVASNASVQYGWVQIYGPSSINVAASAVLNTQLNSTATSGRLDDDATAGSEVIDGVRLSATAGSAGVYAAYLNYPFVGRTL